MTQIIKSDSEYHDLGYDTERWWYEHMKGTMPHLRHDPRAGGWDFVGSVGTHLTYVDVKCYRVLYRELGWIEMKSGTTPTGIISTAKTHYNNANVSVFIAVLHCGRHYMIDAKALWTAIIEGRLTVRPGKSTDDMGRTKPNKNVVIDGWDDPRFTRFEGPLNQRLWAPTTPIGRRVHIDKWMMGEWALK